MKNKFNSISWRVFLLVGVMLSLTIIFKEDPVSVKQMTSVQIMLLIIAFLLFKIVEFLYTETPKKYYAGQTFYVVIETVNLSNVRGTHVHMEPSIEGYDDPNELSKWVLREKEKMQAYNVYKQVNVLDVKVL